MIIEGKNAIFEAVKSNTQINNVFVLENTPNDFLELCKKKNIKVNFVDKKFLDNLSKTKKHQGYIAKIKDFEYNSVNEIIEYANSKSEDPFIIALDNIEDPHNLGSIIRVADCVGAHGIIITKNRCAQVNDTVYKTSAGAINHVKIARVTNLNYTIDSLKKDFFINVLAADANGENIYETNLTGPILLIVGSEGFGISNLTLKKSDKIISIPLEGKVNSLNASVATGIIAYEYLRQKKTRK